MRTAQDCLPITSVFSVCICNTRALHDSSLSPAFAIHSNTRSTASRGKRDCHHGFNMSASQDILIKDFYMNIQCSHDLANFNWTVGSTHQPFHSGCIMFHVPPCGVRAMVALNRATDIQIS